MNPAVKLDENMPNALVEFLNFNGYKADTVKDENLSGSDDHDVLNAATANQRILLTYDADFANTREYPPGSHSGIVVFRLRDQRWASLKEPIRRIVESGTLRKLGKGLAIVDEFRIRIRIP